MSTPQPLTFLQKLAALEAALKADFKKDFGPDMSQLFIAMENPGNLTPVQLAAFDLGQLISFEGKLAADAMKFLPDGQTSLMQILQQDVANWVAAQTAATKK